MAYKSYRKQVEGQLDSTKDALLEKIGLFIKGEAQARSPVQTGAYRDSHDYDVQDDSVIVGNSMEYAVHIELGTSKQRAQRVIENSVMENTSKLKQLVAQEYKAKMKG